MVRPRWHDVAIVGAIAGVLAVGVWALWWDDVRGALGVDHSQRPSASDGSGEVKAPATVSGDRT